MLAVAHILTGVIINWFSLTEFPSRYQIDKVDGGDVRGWALLFLTQLESRAPSHASCVVRMTKSRMMTHTQASVLKFCEAITNVYCKIMQQAAFTNKITFPIIFHMKKKPTAHNYYFQLLFNSNKMAFMCTHESELICQLYFSSRCCIIRHWIAIDALVQPNYVIYVVLTAFAKKDHIFDIGNFNCTFIVCRNNQISELVKY